MISVLPAQRQLAITVDDPNSQETPILNSEQRNLKILEALRSHHVKAALFVCGQSVDDTAGVKMLMAWDDGEHMICNHTYSHLNLNSSMVSAVQFTDDCRHTDSMIRSYRNYTKLFRFPYLKEGNSRAKRDSVRTYLASQGYKNGSVTIDASDWFINAKLTEALRTDSLCDITLYGQYYIRHILERARYYDSLAILVYGRNVKHTLLIHHSLLNALFLDSLLVALITDGWEIIDAAEAYRDQAYTSQPDVVPAGESLVWQYARMNPVLSPSLRYPAEDSRYEEKHLRDYLEQGK